MIKKVVYVMSQRFSGSTILSLLLSKLDQAYFIGEPATLFHRKNKQYKHTWFCTLCKLKDKHHHCPVWGDEQVKEFRTQGTDFLTLLSSKLDPHYDLVIDSSKDLQWIEKNLDPGVEAQIIHITKPVHSWIASMRGRGHSRYPVQFYALEWIRENEAIKRFAAQQNIEYMHVAYEEFAKNHIAIGNQIAKFIGRKFTQDDKIINMHYVRGNPGVNNSLQATEDGLINSKEIVLDERWKKLITQKELESMYSFVGIRKISANFGYQSPVALGITVASNFLNILVYKPIHKIYNLLLTFRKMW